MTYRPLPDVSVGKFGQWIVQQTFDEIGNGCTPDVHAKALEQLLMERLDTFCPLKSFKVGPQDKAWINSELKSLSRRKQREWLKMADQRNMMTYCPNSQKNIMKQLKDL